MKTITIDRIIELIEKRELVFFVGAGISIAKPSNLLNFIELQNKTIWALNHELPPNLRKYYEQIYYEIERGEVESTVGRKFLNIPPEYVYKLCKESLICKDSNNKNFSIEPLNIFRNAKPNKNHFTLAKLLLGKYIPTVFTTNFDLLIENSIQQLSKEEDSKIVKKWKLDQFAIVDNSIPTFYKLHGCINDPSSIVISLDEIGKRCTSSKLTSLKYYLENYYTIFLGYKGADLDIFSYLATSRCKGIIWNTRSEESTLEKIKKLLKVKNGYFIIGDLCDIFETLMAKFKFCQNNNIGTEKSKNESGFDNFTRWSKNSEIYSKIVIIGDLWSYTEYWGKALEFYKFGWKWSKESNQKDIESIFIGRMASVFYKINKYNDVVNCCNLLINNAKGFSPALRLLEYITSLQLLGLVEAKSDPQKANNYFIQCLKYQEKLEKIDKYTRYKKIDILINAGNNLFKGKLFDEAKEIYNNALIICDEFGDVHGRARVLANIGSINLEQNKLDNSISLYKEAEYLFEETSDINELADVLLNLSKAHYRKKIKKKAKQYARKAMIYYDVLLANEQYNNALEIIKKST